MDRGYAEGDSYFLISGKERECFGVFNYNFIFSAMGIEPLALLIWARGQQLSQTSGKSILPLLL